jgi:hypothetical protein
VETAPVDSLAPSSKRAAPERYTPLDFSRDAHHVYLRFRPPLSDARGRSACARGLGRAVGVRTGRGSASLHVPGGLDLASKRVNTSTIFVFE